MEIVYVSYTLTVLRSPKSLPLPPGPVPPCSSASLQTKMAQIPSEREIATYEKESPEEKRVYRALFVKKGG